MSEFIEIPREMFEEMMKSDGTNIVKVAQITVTEAQASYVRMIEQLSKIRGTDISNQDLSVHMGKSKSTVQTHIQNLIKMGVVSYTYDNTHKISTMKVLVPTNSLNIVPNDVYANLGKKK